jgi:linoleoyl-CoA desaturase
VSASAQVEWTLSGWFLYFLLTVKWQFVDDFKELASGRIGGQHIPPPRGWRLWSLLAAKILFIGWAVVLPALLHPIWIVAFCFALALLT